MLKFQSIRRENLLNIKFRHDMTGSIVIFSLRSVPIHAHRKITDPRIDCKLKKKRNQTISNSFPSNVIIISVYHMNVVKNFIIQVARRRIRFWVEVLLSFFPGKQVPKTQAPVCGTGSIQCFLSCLLRITTLWEPCMISLPFSPIFEYFLFASALLPDEKNPERSGRRKEIFGNFLAGSCATGKWLVS